MNRIDHLIYAALDLENGVRDIEERLGVRADGGGQHLGQGTRNKLLALGPTAYLEVITPDPTQPEPRGPRPYGVDGITHSGLVGWAIACDDIDDSLDAARAAGYDPGEVIEGHRLTTSGTLLRWRATANAQVAGLIPFLISWGNTRHPAVDAPPGLSLRSLSVEHPRPTEITPVLAALGPDVEVRRALRPALVARMDSPRGVVELR